MPLQRGDKKPVIMKWQSLQSRMPNEAERLSWKAFHRDGNIGLPLGPESGLVAIDVDTDDPVVLGILQKVLPPSPWRRIGQKGYVVIYKYDGQPIIRIKYKDADGKLQSLVEMLGAGSQIVLPPSIHPKTQQPYRANKDLVDCLSDIRSLPPNIEQILRDALGQAGLQVGSAAFGAVTDYISTGNRDTRLVSMAGLFARDVIKGEKTLLEACAQIELAVGTFMQKTYGDVIAPEKGPQKLIEFLIRDVTGPKARALPKGWDEGVTDEQRAAWGLDAFSKDNETWDHGQIMTYFNAHIEKAGVKDSPEQFTSVVKQVLNRIASNPNLEPIEEDQILNYIATVSARRVSVASVRRQLAQLRAGPIAGGDHAEIAKAVVRDLEDLGGEIRFHLDTLWQWRGSAWEKMDEGDVLKHIINEYGSYKAATRASDHQGILRTVRGMQKGELKKRLEPGINFVNGYLTDELELKEHHPDYGMTYTLPYPYKPELAGKCTRFQRMLNDYWGDDPDYAEKVTALGEVMAMTLFGKMTEVQVAICLYGVAHSGKSRIMEIMQALMPDDAQTTLPPTMWGDKFGPAQLVGKLLNFAGELSETQLIESAKFKQIISGEQIEAQEKNQKMFTFRPKAAHWFASNHHPKSKDSSDGFTRRWLFLVFTRAFPKDERKINDYDKVVIAEEREAIAAWAVNHMIRLRTENFKLTDPVSSIEQREMLENELNSVRDFLCGFRDHGWMNLGAEAHKDVSDQHNYTTFTTLWNEYRSYCISQSVSPVGSKMLVKRMGQLQGQFGFKMDKVSGAKGLPIPVFRYLTIVANRRAAA
ncbi:phage/plasmid primase, P4 family [Methylobacterium sp. WL1]|nr:phage/plasmid primase, P4 family [Methylobacterium sp. WL1]